VIVARVDNDICARTPYQRGRSFKGALDYLLHGHKDTARNPARVVHAETVNIWSDIRDAAHEMAETWANRFLLMQYHGHRKGGGRDNHAPVYRFVISWSPDEDAPSPEEMAAHARQILHLIGLGEHEAVLVVHGDTDNPHIHVVANTVHPVTGRTARINFDKAAMQRYAARYEELNGNVVCKGRITPDASDEFNAAAGARGSGRRMNRRQWERRQADVMEAKRLALPSLILEELTRHHSTFTPADLARAVTDATTTPREFAEMSALVLASPELIKLEARSGDTRYTTRAQKAAEERLAENAGRLAGSIRHKVNPADLATALGKFQGADQADTRTALEHLLDERGLSVIVGYAGAGKSTLLKSAADAWKASGYAVRGLALAGRAAEGLQADADIDAVTIAGFLLALDRGVVSVSADDVIVIDEAGMIGSRQLDRVFQVIREAGAKAVLVGDPEQLQAIEAGGAFRYLVDHYEHVRLSKIWRQQADWMKAATASLAEGRTREALEAYDGHGMVQGHTDKAEAITAILDQWQAGRDRGGTQIILTATNADAAEINHAARERLKTAGALGQDHELLTADGPMMFAAGDRVLFRKNDRRLAVKNGTSGTVVEIANGIITVAIDGRPPRIIRVDPGVYAHIGHGYAVTIHKAQGATVDRAFVLASRYMDRHAAYVALSRHRDRVSFHWTRDQFADWQAVTRTLGRARLKDTTLDYKTAIRQSIEQILASAGTSERAADQTAPWAQLYDQQRREAAAFAGMTAVRRAFWLAANLGRFAKAGVLTLAKLHERERRFLAAALQATRVHPAEPEPRSETGDRTRSGRTQQQVTVPAMNVVFAPGLTSTERPFSRSRLFMPVAVRSASRRGKTLR
jgi:Ti-type conjugative transfer relaxase TraA